MRIGVPKEIKKHEYRVGLVPASVHELVLQGHSVFIEHGAGLGIGFDDNAYQAVGAVILEDAKSVFDKAELIVKVKEPQLNECKMLRAGQTLFTYLHLAPDPAQAQGLLDSGCTAIAYETVTSDTGGLPLLSPMSEVAGRLSVQVGAYCLEKPQGGSGVLLGGVPGVAPANVVVIGGGVVGTNAARMALGTKAHVTVLDRSLKRLQELDFILNGNFNTVFATSSSLESYLLTADLVIGAVLVAGRSAPKLVKRDILKRMRPGSVMIDVAIDQGGCFETSKPTTHDAPTYVVDGIVHYCVANMPGAVPRTAAFALNNATLPFVLALANKGIRQALTEDPHLLNGLNVHKGAITHEAVAADLGKPYLSASEAVQTI
jgi:alanine dehydrogenase